MIILRQPNSFLSDVFVAVAVAVGRQNTSATLLREVGYFFPLHWKLEIKY